MGISVFLNVFALVDDVSPDWQAAENRINALEIGDLKPYFNYWDPDGESQQEAIEGLPDSVVRIRKELCEALRLVRGAVEAQHPDMAVFDLHYARFYATGGASAGAVPSSLYDNVSELDSLGLLSLAGFRNCVVDTGPTREELEMLGLPSPRPCPSEPA